MALTAGMTVEQMTALDLGYAPPFCPVWDPVLVAARKAAAKVHGSGRVPGGAGLSRAASDRGVMRATSLAGAPPRALSGVTGRATAGARRRAVASACDATVRRPASRRSRSVGRKPSRQARQRGDGRGGGCSAGFACAADAVGPQPVADRLVQRHRPLHL